VKIGKDTVVALEVELADLWGSVLERSDRPVRYLHGGYDDLLPALEAALEGKQSGARLELRLEPEDAFGDYDAGLLRIEERVRFPEAVAIGMRFEGAPGEAGDVTIYRVTDIADDKVVLDGNHPHAGVAIKFTLKVQDVRRATAEEIARGGVDEPDAISLRLDE
jgi:FKBP-type peptidyl-prolyl cis-trans isomerase SlyD